MLSIPFSKDAQLTALNTAAAVAIFFTLSNIYSVVKSPQVANTTYEDSIDISDTSHVVLATLGDLTTEYILDKVKKMATAAAVFRAVSWASFEKGIDNILNVLQAETVIGREKMCRFLEPNRVDKGLGSGYQLSTNYRDNFKRGGITLKPMIYNPDTNPITKDPSTLIQVPREIKPLYEGTPISTGHIPNYRGHVPRNLNNPRKKDQAHGYARPIQNDLLLTQRGLGCRGGYAGHNPADCCFHLLLLCPDR
jgi:hypothetical protein